jgi:hypothetical protein
MSRHKPKVPTKTRDAAIKKAGGLEALYDMVAAGMSSREICQALDLPADAVVQRNVRRLLEADQTKYAAAKCASAESLAEKAAEMYGDTAPETSADAKWRNDRAGHMRWMAELRAGLIGKGATVQIDIGQLHMEAMRASSARVREQRLLDAANPRPLLIDAEIVAESPADAERGANDP